MIEYGLIFMAGLLASVHCLGMCGPIVLAYAAAGGKAREREEAGGRREEWELHAAYNAGRIASYALLGALAGLAGLTLSSLDAVSEIVAIAGGTIMLLAGVSMFGLLPFSATLLPQGASGFLRKLHRALLLQRTIPSKFFLGLLTPLLPCGILYAMFAKAATAGSVAGGALTMALFGAGMAPALALMGSFSSFLSLRLRQGAQHLAAATIMLLGVILILRGLHVPYLAWLGSGAGNAAHCH
ncbi:MAG: sulfite exporter TauE/SafE family protein [candidate division KSB1 bacterium]|nr:sulfite exporter TauE/SafE family protein [candidate division KSB1 bacterium]MDZ7314417.1 sulfite exporter TauE/SafE family protein [candidate division KSB1 bacterium]